MFRFSQSSVVRVRSSNAFFRVTKSEDLAKYRLTEVADSADGGENSVEAAGSEA